VLTPLLYTTGINSLLIVDTSSTGTLIVFHRPVEKPVEKPVEMWKTIFPQAL